MKRLALLLAALTAAAPVRAAGGFDAHGFAGMRADLPRGGVCARSGPETCGPRSAQAPRFQLAAATGAQAPAVTLTDLDRNPIGLASLRGRVVLLDFWATWCPPCQASTATLQALHARHAAAGLVVIGVNQQESAARVTAYMTRHRATYRQTIDDGSAAQAFGARHVPTFVLIGRDGRIAWQEAGFDNATVAPMTSAIEGALAAGRPASL